MTTESGPLRVAILTSHDAPGLEELVASPNRGLIFEIVMVVSSEATLVQFPILEAAGIPVVFKPFSEFANDHGVSVRNLRDREDYDLDTAELFRSANANLVILNGYHYILTEKLVAEFPDKIIVLHDGDLTVRDEDGRRRYTGLHAVREAVLHGDRQTRCSAFFVTKETGTGPLFLLSAPFLVSQIARDAKAWGDFDMLTAYTDLHRRWMVRNSFGQMMTRGIEFLAAGRLQVIRELVWIDGVPGPCRMGEAPGVCHEQEEHLNAGIPATCPLIRTV